MTRKERIRAQVKRRDFVQKCIGAQPQTHRVLYICENGGVREYAHYGGSDRRPAARPIIIKK